MQDKGLEILKFNHAGALQLIDGTTINYGVIEVNDNTLEYYTGQGLREMWSPNMDDKQRVEAERLRSLSREEQIKLGLRAIIKLEEIARVLF